MWTRRFTANLTPAAMTAAAVAVASLATIVLPAVALADDVLADNVLADDALADNDLAEDSEPYSEWSGLVGIELRAFASSGQILGQDDDATGSVVLEPSTSARAPTAATASSSDPSCASTRPTPSVATSICARPSGR